MTRTGSQLLDYTTLTQSMYSTPGRSIPWPSGATLPEGLTTGFRSRASLGSVTGINGDGRVCVCVWRMALFSDILCCFLSILAYILALPEWAKTSLSFVFATNMIIPKQIKSRNWGATQIVPTWCKKSPAQNPNFGHVAARGRRGRGSLTL